MSQKEDRLLTRTVCAEDAHQARSDIETAVPRRRFIKDDIVFLQAQFYGPLQKKFSLRGKTGKKILALQMPQVVHVRRCAPWKVLPSRAPAFGAHVYNSPAFPRTAGSRGAGAVALALCAWGLPAAWGGSVVEFVYAFIAVNVAALPSDGITPHDGAQTGPEIA